MKEPLDAYQISKKLFNLWMEHVNKNSGELDKMSQDVPLYATSPFGDNFKVVNVKFVPGVGISLELE